MKFLQYIPFSLHDVVLMDQIINILTLNFTNICNVFICDCFSKLNSYCGHFSQKFHRCKKRVGLDGSKESNIRRPLLSNLTCFHVLHDVHPRYPQFSWCGRYCHVLTYLNNTMLMHQWFNKLTDLEYINAGYLSLTWLEFVVAVWEKSGNYFLWTLWQPCNYIHYDVRDDVTYPSSMFKCENRVW